MINFFFLLKSPTSDKRWPDNVFISGGNPHLTTQFCGVVLDLNTISKMILEPPTRWGCVRPNHGPVLWGCVRLNHDF
jgi:hypothetical protein